MTKKSLLKNYPKISFTKSDFLKVDSEKIWLNFTKEEFDKKIEKERLLMIEKQNKFRPKKRFMMLWGQGYEFG